MVGVNAIYDSIVEKLSYLAFQILRPQAAVCIQPGRLSARGARLKKKKKKDFVRNSGRSVLNHIVDFKRAFTSLGGRSESEEVQSALARRKVSGFCVLGQLRGRSLERKAELVVLWEVVAKCPNGWGLK